MKPLSLADSSVLKGIAILMKLFHHAFFTPGSFEDVTVDGKGLLNTIALSFKLCVDIFVFLSGYGLIAKYGKMEHLNLRSFYRSRFVKLMLNYWFVWLIFVPLSVFCLGDKPFGWSYGYTHVCLKAVLDFFGILRWFGWAYPYNPHWWFYSCIIGLYILFPLLIWIMRRNVLFAIGVALVLSSIPGDLFEPVKSYIISFIIGMFCAKYSSRADTSCTPPRVAVGSSVVCAVLLPKPIQYWCFGGCRCCSLPIL